MYPLPHNPKVVVLVDADGNPLKIASNIAPLPELEVVTTTDKAKFNEEALGKSFNQPAR